MASAISDETKEKLKHQFLVVRQQAIENLVSPLKDGDTSNLAAFQEFVFTLLSEDSWQSKQSAFILSEKLIQHSDTKYRSRVIAEVENYFEFPEHRVREAVADCIGECARCGGLDVYLTVKDKLFALISDNFSRGDDDEKQNDASGPASLAKIQAQKQHHHHHGHDHNHHDHNHNHNQPNTNTANDTQPDVEMANGSVTTVTSSSTPAPDEDGDEEMKTNDNDTNNNNNNDNDNNKGGTPSIARKSDKLKHDTEGWKCLFSAMKTVERIIVGLGLRFESEVTDHLLQLLRRSTKHLNRFIREIAYKTYAAICKAMRYEKLCTNKIDEELSSIISEGLSDNWSQVRYASSHAARNFFAMIPDPQEETANVNKFNNPLKTKYFPVLLPPMCINRYYVAAGVRVYSLESWKLLVGTNGRLFVAKYMQWIQAFFISQAGADNHAVREAACHCIAELATKIDHDAVSKYIPGLLDALIGCFKDASWPVRDAACVALGDFVSQFPDESVNDLKDLYKLWFEHLSDNIPSVREDSAMALGKILKVEKLAKEHGAEQLAVEHIKRYMNEVQKQKSDDKYIAHGVDDMNVKFGAYENATLFGVAAKRIRDNDQNLHSEQQVYSCGSLAPKLKRATRSGCMDHGFSRERAPWEYTDGCVHLLRELIVAMPQSKYFDEFVPAMIPTIASKRNFAHYHELQQTIWKSVPQIAEAVGKRKFKMYLELLLVPMVETLECKNRLAMNAAGNCIAFCNKFIGPRFFLPRLKPDQLKIIQNSQFVQL